MDAILLKNIKSGDRICDIFIRDGIIADIFPAGTGNGAVAAETEVVDCSGKTALPGFINMHTHAAMTLLRGVGEDIRFSDWIGRIWEEEEKIDDDYIYWATKVACLEMLRTGTPSFLLTDASDAQAAQ